VRDGALVWRFVDVVVPNAILLDRIAADLAIRIHSKKQDFPFMSNTIDVLKFFGSM
jgi:hypothetical protein